MCDQEAHDVAHVEEFAAKANRDDVGDQQAGRETAERVREEALYGIEVYQAGDGSEEEEAAKAVVISIQASVDVWTRRQPRRRSPQRWRNCPQITAPQRRKQVDELHLALEQSEDRTRRIRQRAPIKRTTIEPEGWHGRVGRGPV
jgi:hypothetical protein